MNQINRRKFIGTAAAGAAAMSTVLHKTAQGQDGQPELKIGLIGAGNYGMADVRAAFKVGGVEIVTMAVDKFVASKNYEVSRVDL